MLTLAFAIAALVTGLVGSYYWYRSTKIEIRVYGHDSAVPAIAQGAWIAATSTAFYETARLNKAAAIWTAAAVLCGALSSLLAAVGV